MTEFARQVPNHRCLSALTEARRERNGTVMKHSVRLFVLLALCAVVCALACACGTSDTVVQGQNGEEYTLRQDGTYHLTYVPEETEGVYEVPNSFEGHAVSGVGDYAFDGCRNLTAVVLPQGIRSIGTGAFADCTALSSVTFPSTVQSVGAWAFKGCGSLAELVLPTSLTAISDFAFAGCPGLQTVTLPTGLTTLGKSAFYDCAALSSVTLPVGLASIGESAFRDCTALAEVVFAQSSRLTSVGCIVPCSLCVL